MECEVCKIEGVNKEASYYRDLDENPRPLCQEHFNKVGGNTSWNKMMIQRHYVKIGVNKK